MPDRNDEQTQQTQSVPPSESDAGQPGFLHIENTETSTEGAPVTALPGSNIRPATPLPTQALERTGTTEHLAARKVLPEIDVNIPETKARISELRAEVTRLLTSLRWENQSVEETAQHLVPLLNVGPIQQWESILIPQLFEIDRAGALIPTWIYLIEQGDPDDLAPEANPADTPQGRARRFAILMLGNYRTMGILGARSETHYIKRVDDDAGTQVLHLTQFLGHLATDPNTSLYATQALVKHATASALEALIQALKGATGWAKVDVIEGCLSFNQERLYDLVVASGLGNAAGLENYLALPIYRSVPLEKYLQVSGPTNPHLSANAALIINQVLQDAIVAVNGLLNVENLPTLFQRYFPTIALALFAYARSTPNWQNTIAIHRLGVCMGRYWSEISKNNLKDGRIIEQVYQVLPMMNEIERWIESPGRDVLLNSINTSEDEGVIRSVKVLGELRDPRAATPILMRIEATQHIENRQQALMLGALCDTLGKLGDKRAATPMLQLIKRTIDVAQRTGVPKRRDNLPDGDANIPGSIVYAAVIRACGQLGEPTALEGVLKATRDVDPYVRIQAFEALKHLDTQGNDVRSRQAAREALVDPRDSIIRTACQLVAQYHDTDANGALQNIIETRPELAYVAQDALRQLGH